MYLIKYMHIIVILALKMSAPPPTRNRPVRRETSIERVSSYNYSYEADVKPLKGTNIYETVSPHGSHVFVDMGDKRKREAPKSPSPALQRVLELAEESCYHMTGYIVIHPESVVVKHVSGETYSIPSLESNKIRVVPLLTITEIEQDPEHSSLNADKVSTAIMSKMLIFTHETMEEYDKLHTSIAQAARRYFELHSEVLDNSVINARNTRNAMLSGQGNTDHRKTMTESISSIEHAHTHAVEIQSRTESLRTLRNMFEILYRELDS